MKSEHVEKVEVGNCNYEVKISGYGKQSIILLSGYGVELDSWDHIVPELGKHGIVFSYNRLGVGKSDRAKVVQNGRVIVENLRKLLKIKNVDPPYIVLGHSLGGLYANLWARLYPAELCGVAFIEATHPDHEKK